MACNLKVISLNVRGIRNQNKRRAIFCYLKQQKATNFCLQETYSQPDDERIWSAEWGGKISFCHGTVHSKGVCILLNPNSTSNFNVIQTDPQGRILISKLKICEETFFIVNIYAPTDYRDQNEFIKILRLLCTFRSIIFFKSGFLSQNIGRSVIFNLKKKLLKKLNFGGEIAVSRLQWK